MVREAYPDSTALDPASAKHDPKSTAEDPRWYMVDVKAVHTLSVSLQCWHVETCYMLLDIRTECYMALSLAPLEGAEAVAWLVYPGLSIIAPLIDGLFEGRCRSGASVNGIKWALKSAGAEAGPASVATRAEEVQRDGSEGDDAAVQGTPLRSAGLCAALGIHLGPGGPNGPRSC